MNKQVLKLCVVHLLALGAIVVVGSQSNDKPNHLDSNPYFKRYNKLNYDAQDLHEKHLRVRRSSNEHIQLSFKGYGKLFEIRLRPKADNYFDHDYIEVLSDDHVKLIPTNQLALYEGEVTNAPKDSSHVFGTIIDGVFSGTIDLKNEGKYFVETVARYLPEEQLESFGGHSIIYHENDVNSHETVQKSKQQESADAKGSESVKLTSGSCGLNKKHVRAQLLEIQRTFAANASAIRNQVSSNEPFYYKYTKEANMKANPNKRSKRQSINQRFFPNSNLQNTCGMYLKVDPYLYNQIFFREGKQVSQTWLCFKLLIC